MPGGVPERDAARILAAADSPETLAAIEDATRAAIDRDLSWATWGAWACHFQRRFPTHARAVPPPLAGPPPHDYSPPGGVAAAEGAAPTRACGPRPPPPLLCFRRGGSQGPQR